MGTPRPFQFDNFIIADGASPAVLDLNKNRSRPEPPESDIGQLLKNIDAKLEVLLGQDNRNNLKLVRMILAELSPALMQQQSLEVAAAFIASRFPEVAAEKVLDFYFHPDIIYDIQPKLAALAKKNNFEGRLLLHKDSTLAPFDCRIVWGKNSREYNGQQKTAAILRALSAPERKNENDR